jgi:hypothetical protein
MSQVTPVSAWKKKLEPVPLELPSGNTCLVQPVGMEVFLKQGFIPNSLMGVVQQGLKAGEPGKLGEVETDELMTEALQDPEKLQDIFNVADAVTVYCVIEPKVHPAPTDENLRKEDELYVDEIDMDDKMFIFQFAVGGSRDLEPFRAATSAALESVSGSDRVQLPPEPDGGGG